MQDYASVFEEHFGNFALRSDFSISHSTLLSFRQLIISELFQTLLNSRFELFDLKKCVQPHIRVLDNLLVWVVDNLRNSFALDLSRISLPYYVSYFSFETVPSCVDLLFDCYLSLQTGNLQIEVLFTQFYTQMLQDCFSVTFPSILPDSKSSLSKQLHFIVGYSGVQLVSTALFKKLWVFFLVHPVFVNFCLYAALWQQNDFSLIAAEIIIFCYFPKSFSELIVSPSALLPFLLLNDFRSLFYGIFILSSSNK